MNVIDKNTFFELTENFAHVPCSQTRGIYALSDGKGVKFFVDNTQKIACMAHEKRFLWLKMLLIDGECYAEKTDFDNRKKTQRFINDLRQFYLDFTAFGYDMIETVSNDFYNFNYEIALRQAGFLRPVGAFSMPLTKIVDLTKEISYNKSWHLNVKKSEKFDLKFIAVEQITLQDCADFIHLSNAMSNRKNVRYYFSEQQIFQLCANGDYQLFFAEYETRKIAAIIVSKNLITKHIGLYLAATGETALQTGASAFLYLAMFAYLQQNGFVSYDTEKLVPSTKSVNSVFQFKNGIDGRFEVLNGEFSWYKRQIYRPMMYFVKKYLLKRREI